MKKMIWIIVALVVGGYFVNSYLENKAKREAEQAEIERIEQATKSAVAQMVSQTGAIEDWESRLSKGKEFRFEPILTVELERLWLQNRPILFVGSIRDIATQDQSHYTIIVERSLFSSLEHIFSSELELSLVSNKEQIDTFLKKYPNLFTDYGLDNNGVAVIAHISAIRTVYFTGDEGDREEIKIGDGELIDIMYTGDIYF